MAPRGKKHELGMLKMEEKAHILAWKEEGVSSVEIAKQLQRHKLSIDRLVVNAKNYPSLVTPPRKKGSGGVRKMDKTLKTILKRQVLKYPMMMAAELQTSVVELQAVSERTIQRTLQIDLKMASRVATMKPLLTDKMKAKRVKFAKAYSHFTAEDWSKVMCLNKTKN
jgi:IS30 family transposase